MAKRFTDTDKWKREWFYELDPKAKLAWLYLLDQCDHCGIWPRNFKLMSEQIGFKVDHGVLTLWFGSKLISFDEDKYFIPSFFEFQYGASKEGFKAKHSALATLQRLGLFDEHGNLKCSEHLGNSTEHLGKCSEQSMDCPSIGISKSISKSIERESVREKTTLDFEALYKKYPLKEGKQRGIEKCRAQIKTLESYEQLSRAIDKYIEKKKGTDPKFLKHFDSFMSTWRDHLDQDSGLVTLEPAKPKWIEDYEREKQKKLMGEV